MMKMINKARRTRVLDTRSVAWWLFAGSNLEVRYTQCDLADIRSKGSFHPLPMGKTCPLVQQRRMLLFRFTTFFVSEMAKVRPWHGIQMQEKRARRQGFARCRTIETCTASDRSRPLVAIWDAQGLMHVSG